MRDMPKQLSKNPDVIFVSYDEPEADENYARLLSFEPASKRVHGVKGINNAMVEAARQATSSHFYVVDGDNWVLDGFAFGWPEPSPSAQTYIWPAVNAVNKLAWYNGGLKFVSRDALLSIDVDSVDFFLTIEGKRGVSSVPATETRFNSSPFLAWRCGFRECAKLSGGVGHHPQLPEILQAWQTVGMESRNGEWCILGSRMGAAFGRENYNGEMLGKLNDMDWLKEKFQGSLQSIHRTQSQKPFDASNMFPANPLEEKLTQGMVFHRQGNLDQAEKLYGEIIALLENKTDAIHLRSETLHLMGVIKFQRGRPERALEFIDKAIALKPDHAEAHNNRGIILQELKKLDHALASYERVIGLKPGYAEAHYNRGNVLDKLERYDEALASYDLAIRLKPDFAEARNNRALVLKALGDGGRWVSEPNSRRPTACDVHGSASFGAQVQPPRFLFLQVNKRCNLRCQHCAFWRENDSDRPNYLSREEKGRIMRDFAAMNPHGAVVICGGESMLDLDDYFDLCHRSRDLRLTCLSVVNGTRIRTPAMAERMITEGPHEISVSLNSHREGLHDETRGVVGAFEKAVQAMRLLVEARRRVGDGSTKLYVMGLIFDQNYLELEEFYDFVLNDIGADKLKLNFIQPSFGNSEEDAFLAAHHRVDPDELVAVIRKCERRFGLAINPAWLANVKMYFESLKGKLDLDRGWASEARTQEHICNTYERNIMVDHYGTARLCFSTDFRGASVRAEGELRRFWEEAGDVRKEMRSCNKLCGISHSVRRQSCTLTPASYAVPLVGAEPAWNGASLPGPLD